MNRLALACAGALAPVFLGACAPLVTQSPGKGLSPVNAVSQGDDPHLILSGHDVVSYFTQNAHRMGSPGIKSLYKGVTFRFSKPEHKALFDGAPEKYIPQFGGFCANGIAYAIPWGGDADTWWIHEDRLYIFGGSASRDAFMLDPARNLALARKYWNEEVNGSNAFVQRTKRLVLRVPHYKSGAELAADVRKAKK